MITSGRTKDLAAPAAAMALLVAGLAGCTSDKQEPASTPAGPGPRRLVDRA